MVRRSRGAARPATGAQSDGSYGQAKKKDKTHETREEKMRRRMQKRAMKRLKVCHAQLVARVCIRRDVRDRVGGRRNEMTLTRLGWAGC